MKRAGPAVIAALLASLIGCYSDAIEPSPPPDASSSAIARPTSEHTPTPTPEPVEALDAPVAGADELLYYCHRVAFPPSALAGPGGVEVLNHPAAIALRQFVVGNHELALLPESGWHYLGESLDTVEFGLLVSDPIEPSGTAHYVTFNRIGLVYELGGFGDCLPRRVAPPGFIGVEWWLPGLVSPKADATKIAIDAVVTGCNAGPDVELIEPPHIQADATSINIALVAESVGRTGCARFECSEMAPTLLEVVLPEAVGLRRLYDGFTFPPRDAATEVALGSCAGG